MASRTLAALGMAALAPALALSGCGGGTPTSGVDGGTVQRALTGALSSDPEVPLALTGRIAFVNTGHHFPYSEVTPGVSWLDRRGQRGGLGIGSGPTWSPDGKRVAFHDAEQKAIYVSGVAGSAPKLLTADGGDPAWSPRGDKIAYCRGDPLQIWVMNADGTSRRQLTRGRGDWPESYQPAWSPDGRRIVFGRRAQFHSSVDLYVMNVDGSGLKRLTNTPGVWEWAPDWSPDGRRIVCTDDKAIYVLGADGSGMAKWGGNYVHDLSEGASWGPGSRHIAYAWHCRDCEKPSSGLVVQAAGARPTTLLSSVASGWPMKSWTEYADCDWWGPKG